MEGQFQVDSNIIRTCILSHGRSGTLYTAMILRSIGLDFGHEEDGTDGAIGGIFFHEKRYLDSYGQIFHQLRHPLKTISSSTTCKADSFKKVFREIGIDDIWEDEPLRRAMLSWIHYVKWAERHSVWRYKIEDFPKIWPELLFRMNVPRVELPNLPVNINTRLHQSYTWNDLMAADSELTKTIKDMAWRFGYEL